MRKVTFVVGRSSPKGKLLLFLSAVRSPILGPWTLRAMVSTN